MKNLINKIKKIFIKILTESWFMYDPNFEISNEKWRIHKCDEDKNFPSIPHMDCVTDSRKKMNIYTGEIYLKNNRKRIGKARQKELKRLWSDYEFRKIVYDERRRYNKLYNKEVKELVPDIYVEEYNEYISKYSKGAKLCSMKKH